MANKKQPSKDEIVVQLQEIVKKKKAEISKIEKPVFFTNNVLHINGVTTNLNTINDPYILGTIAGELLMKEQAFNKGAVILDIDKQFSHQGHTVDEWMNDIHNRLGKIELQQKKKELSDIEARLDKLVSKELREQKELEELSNLLK